MQRVVFLLGLVVCAFASNAQTLRVQLINKTSSETIPFAYVHLLSQTGTIQNTVQTNENGVVEIIPDTYPFTIEINALGYESAKKDFYTKPANTNITLYLEKKFSTLNEVVVTGLTAPERQKDALSVYKIITRDQIQAQGAVTLDEVMKNQLNVRVSNDNILGTNMRMQGLGGDKVKILIDGIPLNGREGGNINLSQINMANVDRIEIIQGPMSVAYGSDAIGGTINIIMRKEQKPFSVSAGAYYGSLGNYNADVSVTKRIAKKHQFTLGGGRNRFDGWKLLTIAHGYDKDSLYYSRGYLFKPNEQYLGNFAYNYSATSGFSLRFASDYLHEKVTNKGNLETWHPFNGAYVTDEYYYTNRSMNRLSMNGKLGSKGTWQMQNGYMLYHRVRNSYRKDMVTLNQELSKKQGSQDTSTFTDLYSRAAYSNTVKRLGYTVGYDVNLQYALSQKVSGERKQIQDYALYTNLSYDIIEEKLKAQAGLRGAYNSVYKPPLIPSINLLYTPVKKVQIRASYAEGYRAPSLKEMYLSFIDVNHEILGNENLTAESSRHLQLSTSYQVYEKTSDYFQLSLTGFYNDVSNGITLAPVHPEDTNSIEYTYANVAVLRNAIITLQADGQLQNLHYQLGYSRNATLESSGNAGTFSASEATATLQYTWKKPGVSFNTFYKLSGKQPFLQANIDGSASYNGTQSAFHLCDVSVEKKFFERKLQVIAGVKNVFDFQQATVTGRVTSGAHGGGTASFLPRSFFTSVRLSIN